MEAAVVTLYAGFAAEVEFDPKSRKQARLGACGDDRQAKDLLAVLERDGRKRRTRQARLRNRAARFVQAHWQEIQALATKLVERKMLDGAEAGMIVEAAAGDKEAIETLAFWKLAGWSK